METKINETEVLVKSMQKSLSAGQIDDKQYNFISSLFALFDNDYNKTSRIISCLVSEINSARWELSDEIERQKRKEWEKSLTIGSEVQLYLGKSRRFKRYYSGKITKIYNGKKGKVYTVKLDNPYIIYRRWTTNRKEIFKVTAEELDR